MRAVVIKTKENKAAVLMKDGSMRYIENKGYSQGTVLELPDTELMAEVTPVESCRKASFHLPYRFMYSAAASLLVLSLSGAMVSYACPVSNVALPSDPSVTLGVNIYGKVVDINIEDDEKMDMINDIRNEIAGKDVSYASEKINTLISSADPVKQDIPPAEPEKDEASPKTPEETEESVVPSQPEVIDIPPETGTEHTEDNSDKTEPDESGIDDKEKNNPPEKKEEPDEPAPVPDKNPPANDASSGTGIQQGNVSPAIPDNPGSVIPDGNMIEPPSGGQDNPGSFNPAPDNGNIPSGEMNDNPAGNGGSPSPGEDYGGGEDHGGDRPDESPDHNDNGGNDHGEGDHGGGDHDGGGHGGPGH